MNSSWPLVLLVALFSIDGYAQSQVSLGRVDRTYESALNLLQHGEYGSARLSFQNFLSSSSESDPRRVEAAYYESLCALNLYHADGEKMIEDFVSRYRFHPRASIAYYDLANFFYTEKNYGRASAYFGKVDFPALSDEQHGIGRFHWGYSLFNLRKLNEALDQFNFIKSLGGQFGPASSYYSGFIEISNGDFENALVDLRRAETSASYSSIVPHLITHVYYKQGKYDDLLSYSESVLGREGLANIEGIHLLQAEAHFKKKNYKEALAGYEAHFSSANSSTDKAIKWRAGFAAYSQDENERAIHYLHQVASDKDSIGFYSSYYLGSLYLRQNQKLQALTAFEISSKFKAVPALVEESIFQSAKIAYELGQPDVAIGRLEELLASYPSSIHATEVKELLSQAYVNANNFNKAIAYIEALPSRGPAINRAYQKATFLKGVELFNMERYPEAVHSFEKSLQYPEDKNYVVEANFWCAEAYSLGGKFEAASENYLKVLGITGVGDELMTKTRYGLGYAYFNMKQYDRALFNFKEFVKGGKDALLADGVVRLADCYYVTKAYPEALATYRRSIQLRTADTDYALLQSGVILGIQKKYGEAAAAMDQVITGHTKSRFMDEALFQRAQLEFEQGRYAQAVAGFTRLINSNSSSRFVPYAYMRRAASNYNLKEYSKTAGDYSTVIDNYSSHPVAADALLPLQEVLNLLGKGADFENHLTIYKQANPEAKGIEEVEFETSKNYYFNQDYPRAIQRITQYANAYPESPRLNEARYYQAESYYRLKDFARSLETHRTISGDATFPMYSRVIARISELEYKLGNYGDAVNGFLQLEKISSNKKEQFNAWTGLMESYYMLSNYDSADIFARRIIEGGSVSAGAQNKASLFLGKSAMARGDYETATDEFLNTLNTARDEYGAEAKYLIGEIFFLKKNHPQCYETLVGLNKDFSAYIEWVGKSYLLLSDNFVATGDLFQAKGTLNSLIEHFPTETVKMTARERLRKIDQLEVEEKKKELSDSLEIKND